MKIHNFNHIRIFLLCLTAVICIYLIYNNFSSLSAQAINSPDDDDLKDGEVLLSKDISQPDDPLLDKQWAYSSYSRLVKQGDERIVIVAVLDTGIDRYHEDLENRVIEDIDFSGSSTTLDRYGHGTKIAGIIAANTDNHLGIAGLSEHARLLNVKVADDEGKVYASNMAKGIIWAVDRGAKVINISLCIACASKELEEAVVYAWENDAVIVAAAGNCGSTGQVPACYPLVIPVGALNTDYTVWQKSNQQDCIDVYAPGVEIYSTIPGNKYGYTSGTSMSAAFISAAAAELMTVTADANMNGHINDEVSAIIRDTFKK